MSSAQKYNIYIDTHMQDLPSCTSNATYVSLRTSIIKGLCVGDKMSHIIYVGYVRISGIECMCQKNARLRVFTAFAKFVRALI